MAIRASYRCAFGAAPKAAGRLAARAVLAVASILAGWLGTVPAAATEAPALLKISVPGPRNLSFLPLDLMARIGADRAEGAEVHVKHVDGGSSALQELSSRNVDFVAAGVPAMLSQQANGEKVVVLAAVNDLPLYLLLVRADLRKQVRTIADLKGRPIGVTTSSLASKTTSQQLVELLLMSAGVPSDMIRIVPAGQSWSDQSSLLLTGTVDALMSFEPVASRLLAENRVYVLANLADPGIAARIPGSGFLLGALATRPEILEHESRKAEKMVAILRRTLQWMAVHTPEQIVDALSVKDPGEKQALLGALRRYRRLYSLDGRLSTRQLQDTETFFHKTHEGNPAAQRVRLESMVDDRWAGRRE